ncbi:MAG: glycoside hydrolase family 3 protein [Clostridia bacterium]|nr:glycoside hydrolase family 3 protein [Clostridia bacterium]
MKGKTNLMRGLTILLACLFIFSLFATSIANANASTINANLGTSSYSTVQTGDSGNDGTYFRSEFSDLKDVIDAKEALAVEISQEGTVLFKNDGSLPLAKTDKVTIWGLNSISPTFGGLIGSTVGVNYEKGQRTVTLIDAMKERGFSVNDTMLALYNSEAAQPYYRAAAFFGQAVPGHSLVPVFWPTYGPAEEYGIGELPASVYTQDALDSAKDTAAIVFISRDSSEAADYSLAMQATNGDHFDRVLALSDYEKAMIELAKQYSNGKVVVVLNSDMTLEIEELKQDSGISAIVWAGLPGAYGFYGVADVLSGDANPSGHIADTYAASSISAPAMQNFGVYTYTNASITEAGVLTGDDKGDWYVVETEGIYVGYKYYETRYEDAVLGRSNASSDAGTFASTGAWDYATEMSYPFGYGKSYTTFNQELLDVTFNVGGESKATVRVTNTGSVAGKDVVQLYAQAPYTAGGLEKAAIQLVGFAKTKTLAPNESEEVTVSFDAKYAASYDNTAVKANGTVGAWVLDAGDYYFAIGNGAHEALNNVLANKLGSTDALVKINDDEVIDPSHAKKITLVARDIETYSENVENALTGSDINEWIPNAAEYTTRADWTKGWQTVTGLTATPDMLVGLTNKTRELTANGSGETWGAQNGLTLADMLILNDNNEIEGIVDINDPLWDQLVDEVTFAEALDYIEKSANMQFQFATVGSFALLKDGPIGFVNDQVPGYGTNWTASNASEPTYVGSDNAYAEWCMAVMPTEPVVAATFNAELVEREGELFGEDSLWSNVSAEMGPGLNNHRATYCARNHEYYSEDAMLTNILGVAVSVGASHKGMMMEPKHFALNHQEANRSGVSTYNTEQAIREIELRGFQGALETNTARGVMTAFNRIGTVYSGGHTGLLTQILRNEWGFNGFIVTDAINGGEYMNWRDVVLSGGGGCLNVTAFENSIIGSPTTAENQKLISQDTSFQQEVKKAIKYSLYAFAGSNAMNGMTSDTKIVRAYPWWEITLYVLNVVTGVLALGACALYVASLLKKKEQ